MDSKEKSSMLSSTRTSSTFSADGIPERTTKGHPKDSILSSTRTSSAFSLDEKSKSPRKDRPKKGAWPPTPGFRHDLKKSWAKHAKNGYRWQLQVAVNDGNADEVRRLLLAGADLNDGPTAPTEALILLKAIDKGHSEVVRALLEAGASPHIRGSFQVLPIHAAARGGYLDIAKQLVAAGSAVNDDGCHGRTPLYLATAINDRALVEFFLQAGADVNLGRDKPVAAAVENGIRGIGILKLLIAAGADVNLQSGLLSTGPNPQYEGVVKILLEAGIDVNGSRHQWTGLATAAAQGAGKIVKLLLEAGADPNLAAEPGASPPLRWAAARGHPGVVKLLIDAGAEIEGQGLMVAAARSKNFTVLRILLDAGVPVDDVDRLNYTALREASDNGAEDVVRLLLDRGADTNCAPVWRNPLYAALKKGHPGVVKMLIDAGADTTLPSAREGNALQVAAQWGYPKIIKILSAAGVTADPGVDYYERARQREDERAREDR